LKGSVQNQRTLESISGVRSKDQKSRREKRRRDKSLKEKNDRGGGRGGKKRVDEPYWGLNSLWQQTTLKPTGRKGKKTINGKQRGMYMNSPPQLWKRVQNVPLLG